MSASTLDRSTIVADLAEVLGVSADQLDDETNVFDTGLDSVRLMSLIERWRAAGALRADIAVLAADPVLGSWVRELTEN
ncbi:MAG: phosphopantetheine-binding protein [Gordonia sp. (in: high G+C Gram-positive bacteria)]